MAVLSSLTRAKTHVRCGSPDCDWGTPMPGLGEGEWNRCRDEFREHCIERHGLGPEDTERLYWLDLEALTLTLLDAWGALVAGFMESSLQPKPSWIQCHLWSRMYRVQWCRRPGILLGG